MGAAETVGAGDIVGENVMVGAGVTISSALSVTIVVFDPNSVDTVCSCPPLMASSIALE